MFIENIKLNYLTAFLTGMLSGAHCVGMCGGIIFALSSALPKKHKNAACLFYACYNIGRVLSYCVSGIIVGFLGFLIIDLTDGKTFLVVKILGGISLISIGFYLGGWLSVLNFLEKIGFFFWLKAQPYLAKLFPIKNFWHAILIGILWGNIPCGLVYAMLLWSLSVGSVTKSVVLMIFFGAGTLPVMFLSLFFISYLKDFFNNKFIRQASCVCMVAFGILNIANVIFLNRCH